jgi:hypothetical protein
MKRSSGPREKEPNEAKKQKTKTVKGDGTRTKYEGLLAQESF